MLPIITGEFRAVADPSLRFTPTGMAVAEFRVAANSRKFDEETKQWVDDKVVWLTVVAFKKLAENVAESVVKGSLVTVTGKLQTEDWETKEGEKRQTYKVIADTISMSLALSPAKVMSGARSEGASRSSGPPADDPFAAPAGGGDEPPF